MDKLHSKMVFTTSPIDEDNSLKSENYASTEMEKNFVSAFRMLFIIFGIIFASLYVSYKLDLKGTIYDSPAASSSVNSNYAEMQKEIDQEYCGDLYEYVKDNIGKVQK